MHPFLPFIDNSVYEYAPIKLPVSVTAFFEALPTADKEIYMNRWKSISGSFTASFMSLYYVIV